MDTEGAVMGETIEIDGTLDTVVAMPVGVVKEGSRVTEELPPELPPMDIEGTVMGEFIEIDGTLDTVVGMPVGLVKEGSRVTKELPPIDIEGAFMGETIEIDGTDVVRVKHSMVKLLWTR